jgi:hypothetical protein
MDLGLIGRQLGEDATKACVSTGASTSSAAARAFTTSSPRFGGMFSLGNPRAGDVVLPGDYVVSGATGSAIDRVQLFLDDRDTGGTLLETVTPVNGTFSVTVTIPTTTTAGHDFVAYARSSVTGQEARISVPIFVGAAPTPTARPSTS